MNPAAYLVLSAILFSTGLLGFLIRRNALIAFRYANGNLLGQVGAFFVMVVAAGEVVIGLAIIMIIFRTRRSASVDDQNQLKY